MSRLVITAQENDGLGTQFPCSGLDSVSMGKQTSSNAGCKQHAVPDSFCRRAADKMKKALQHNTDQVIIPGDEHPCYNPYMFALISSSRPI